MLVGQLRGLLVKAAPPKISPFPTALHSLSPYSSCKEIWCSRSSDSGAQESFIVILPGQPCFQYPRREFKNMCLLFTFLAILYLYTMCLDPLYSPAESSYPLLFKNKKHSFLFPPLSLCASGICCAAVDRVVCPLVVGSTSLELLL